MNQSEEAVRIIAELRKTPSYRGSYLLEGQLPGGQKIQIVANQRKNRLEDADSLVLEVIDAQDDERGKEVNGRDRNGT